MGLFHRWPEQANYLPTPAIQKLYETGYAGAIHDPEAWKQFFKQQATPRGADATKAFSGSAENKLTIPFINVLELFPGCWPGKQGQGRGDCVSWGSRNASLMTMSCDIAFGKPDPISGKIEGKPDVPAEGIADGVLSTEAYYWWRGYNGDGWSCPAVANVATSTSGAVIRKKYDQIDLTSYSSRTAGAYGSRQPPFNLGSDHKIQQATNARTFEERRDLLANGYGILTCGDEGFSSKRDENGLSSRSGSWAHSMSDIGYDDRDVTKQKFGEALVLVLNSWAIWNSGGRDIYQSAALVPPEKKTLWESIGIVNKSTGNIMIPEGSFWTKWSNVRNRSAIAYSGVNGWPAKELPWIF